ncbi:hypothetical protein BC834DRAFT_829325, partial [Gloeopeniophorella convolvens]
YARAAKAELAKDLNTAFRLYVDAGSAFLALSRAAAHPRAQEQARGAAGRALERAERIKAVKRDLTPVLRDPFAPEEQQLVLKKGSVVNSVAAPLWTAAVPAGQGQGQGQGQVVYSDPDGLLALSPEQREAGVFWRRPSEMLAGVELLSPGLRPEDIVQRVVADCSLCASIIVCLLHSRTHGSDVPLPTLYPHGTDGALQLSPTGGYELRVLFNGAYRRVSAHTTAVMDLIDDRLPFSPDGRRMCMTTKGRVDMWPSLVEKAFLKLMGGYDFPGSNSSVDIHALAGWIPDYLEVKSPSFQREQTWSRLVRGFSQGQCVLTVGTDNRPTTDKGRVRLLPAHCYAVTDVKELEDGSRWLTILDSWLPKRGADSRIDALVENLSLDGGDADRERVIDIAWDDTCSLFGSICVSWNPRMFKNQLLYHGIWKASYLSEARKEESTHQTLRLLIERPKGAPNSSEEVWVLLTRHRTDTHRSSEFISLHVEYDDGHPDAPRDFADSDTVRMQGVYTDNPHVLVRTSVPPAAGAGTLSLNISYDGAHDDVGFTAAVYSALAMRWDAAPRRLPFDAKVAGALTAKTSGGNYTLPTFMLNPQYRLRVAAATGAGLQAGPAAKTRVGVALHAPRDVPVNVTAVWGRGERVFDLAQSDIAATSGVYTYGFACFFADLPPGDFTLAVSAFAPTHQGAFTLLVCSARRVALEPIPQEGAGMFAKTARGAWCVGTYAGPPAARRPGTCWRCPSPHRSSAPARFSTCMYLANAITHRRRRIRLQPHPPAFVRVALAPLASSGAYTDARSGAATAQVALRAGQYIVLPLAEGAPDGGFGLVVYSSSAATRLAPL